jgi:hypothetical protein
LWVEQIIFSTHDSSAVHDKVERKRARKESKERNQTSFVLLVQRDQSTIINEEEKNRPGKEFLGGRKKDFFSPLSRKRPSTES